MAVAGTLIAQGIPYLLIWITSLLLIFFVPTIMPTILGGILFVVCELVTLEGIQLSPFSRHKVHILKGMHRKGEPSEYIFVALIAILALILPAGRHNEFAPYMFEWDKYYQEGLIDGREWKDHRFEYF